MTIARELMLPLCYRIHGHLGVALPNSTKDKFWMFDGFDLRLPYEDDWLYDLRFSGLLFLTLQDIVYELPS